MIGPFTEEQIAYMQTSAEKRELFRVDIKLKDKNGRQGKISLYGDTIDDFDEYYEELWGEPYLIQLHMTVDNGNSGFGSGYRVDEFLNPSVREWLSDFWNKRKQAYDFEEPEEQMRWF